MASLSNSKSVMIIAGEASGDLHGSKLVEAMRERDETLVFCGIGGPALKKVGVEILVDASELSVVGITEVFARLPDLFRECKSTIVIGKYMRAIVCCHQIQ